MTATQAPPTPGTPTRAGRARKVGATIGVLAIAGAAFAFFQATDSSETVVAGGELTLTSTITPVLTSGATALFPLAGDGDQEWELNDFVGKQADAQHYDVVLENSATTELAVELVEVTGTDVQLPDPSAEPDPAATPESVESVQINDLYAVFCGEGATAIDETCEHVIRLGRDWAAGGDAPISFGTVDAGATKGYRAFVFLIDSGVEQAQLVQTTLAYDFVGRTADEGNEPLPDADGDGTPDEFDSDIDGDGIANDADTCPEAHAGDNDLDGNGCDDAAEATAVGGSAADAAGDAADTLPSDPGSGS